VLPRPRQLPRPARFRFVFERVLPVRERFTLFGDLAFWLSLIVAASLLIVALARPQARVVIVRKSGADIVILQDGSASMYVKDVKPDRWRRSVQFLRVFADALSWKGDRVALMRKGRLVQIGKALDLYRAPKDILAARTFSDLNELAARIEQGSASTPLGRFFAGGIADGKDATVCIRQRGVRLLTLCSASGANDSPGKTHWARLAWRLHPLRLRTSGARQAE
jgi:hypothetical protein